MFFLFGWFFLCFFSPHIPHVVMYFFCHLLPVWLLHLIFSVALPAVLKCSSGISQVSNAVQPVCVLLANEQIFFPCFLMLFYTDTITLSQFGLLPPPQFGTRYKFWFILYGFKGIFTSQALLFSKLKITYRSSTSSLFLMIPSLTVPQFCLSPVSTFGGNSF